MDVPVALGVVEVTSVAEGPGSGGAPPGARAAPRPAASSMRIVCPGTDGRRGRYRGGAFGTGRRALRLGLNQSRGRPASTRGPRAGGAAQGRIPASPYTGAMAPSWKAVRRTLANRRIVFGEMASAPLAITQRPRSRGLRGCSPIRTHNPYAKFGRRKASPDGDGWPIASLRSREEAQRRE